MTRSPQSFTEGLPTDPKVAADWWLARRSLRSVSSKEENLFQAWLQVPEHAAAYAAASALYDGLMNAAAEPELLRMRAEALRVRPAAVSGFPRLVAGIAMFAVLIAGAVGIYGAGKDGATSASDSAAIVASSKRYETKVGERRQVHLDDGSTILLNTGSAVEVVFSRARRDIRLVRGEALFEVAHNKAWPFVVTAGDRHVTAVGTAFNVRLSESAVEVVLVEGKVRIDPLQPRGLGRIVPQLDAEELVPGEQMTVRSGASETKIMAADVQRVTSWRQGQVVFRDDDLASAVAEFNRYSDSRILVVDPRVAALKVSGVFSTDRPQNFVAAVARFYPLEVHQRSPNVVELTWRDAE